jgi:hypothetical protein
MKHWYQSKTIWIAILQGIAGIMVAVATEYQGLGSLMIVKSIVDIIIRYITTESISFK